MSLFENLSKRRESVRGEIDAILSGYGDDAAELSEADTANLTELKDTISSLDVRLSELADLDKANAAHDALYTSRRVESVSERTPTGTLGARFVASSEFDAYRKSGFSGTAPTFTTEFTTVGSIVGGDALGGTSQVSDAATPRNLTPIVDSFSSVRVSTNATWYLKWPEQAPAAGTVDEGAAKPEATWQPAVVKSDLVKYAHWLQVTEEALEDVPRMRTEIDTALVEGVRRAAEAAAAAVIVGGAGSYLDAEVATGGKLIESIRLGLALVQDYGYQPNAVYINPVDYAELDMLLLSQTLNGAVAMTNPWGLQYIPSSGIVAGTAFVADSQAAFQFQDRGNLSVKMTDSHASNFISNIYTVIGEARGLSVLRRPSAVAACSVATT